MTENDVVLLLNRVSTLLDKIIDSAPSTQVLTEDQLVRVVEAQTRIDTVWQEF
jgi:hypothetical protein